VGDSQKRERPAKSGSSGGRKVFLLLEGEIISGQGCTTWEIGEERLTGRVVCLKFYFYSRERRPVKKDHREGEKEVPTMGEVDRGLQLIVRFLHPRRKEKKFPEEKGSDEKKTEKKSVTIRDGEGRLDLTNNPQNSS